MTWAATLRGGRAVALAILAFAPLAQAAEQPAGTPGDFRNGQSNSFGAVSLTPYLDAGPRSVPVEARIVLHDLAALRDAANVLLAFNLKGDSASVVLDAVRSADGQALAPTSMLAADGGRQPQAHFDPDDLLPLAVGGRVEVVLSGRVEAKANGQSHLGAMAIAFDEAWGILPSGDGSAQVYGFTMVMAAGVGGGAMPFQGQGNTGLVLPVAAVAFALAVAGAMALRSAAVPVPAVIPAGPTSPRKEPRAAGLAVFGSTASPLRAPPRPAVAGVPTLRPPAPPASRAGQAPSGPRQGPVPPTHPLLPSLPLRSTIGAVVARREQSPPAAPSPLPRPAEPPARPSRRPVASLSASPRTPGRSATSRPKPRGKAAARSRPSASAAPRRQASR